MKERFLRLLGQKPDPVANACKILRKSGGKACQFGVHIWDPMYANYTPLCCFCGHKLHWNDEQLLVFQWGGDHRGRGLVSASRDQSPSPQAR